MRSPLPQIPPLRPPVARAVRRSAAVLTAVLLVVAGGFWWFTSSEVTWSTELDGAYRVVDFDADRVLVETFDDELVMLDRSDGSDLSVAQLPVGSFIDQMVLAPGCLVVSW